MDRRRWTAVAVADGLIASGGTLLLIALSRVFDAVLTLAPQPAGTGENLLVLAGLTLLAMAPLAAARITGRSWWTGVVAAGAGLAAVWLAIVFDPRDGSLMPLAFGMGVAAVVALAGSGGRQRGERGIAVLVVTGLAVIVPTGAGEAAVVLLAFPAVALADHVRRF